MPGYAFYSWYGLWGPKGLSPAIVRQVREAAVKAASQKDFAEKTAKNGYELILSDTPEFADYLKKELAKNEALIGKLGIKE